MNLIKIIFTCILFIVSFFGFTQKTEIVYLSGTDADNPVKWDFYCTDGRNSGEWTTIDVPSNWELKGFGTYNYGHDWSNENIKLGKEHGLYKYKFEVPKTWKGKTINIVFEGSMTDTKVLINGKQAGEFHQGGFYRFRYDISKLLKYGKSNILEIDVAKQSENESVNLAERQADYWIFGGIYRPVFLEILPEIHMDRVAVNAKADGSFNVLVEMRNTQSDYSFSIDLFDLKGNKVGKTITGEIHKNDTKALVSGTFENIISWNPEWPILYDMQITLFEGDSELHKITKRIGFRTVELRKQDGFYINGKKVVFKGVDRHSFWPETGRCLSEEVHLTDIHLIKEMNMNAVRMSHYPPDERFLELCDSLGLFVLDEVAGWQQGYDTIVGPKVIRETILKDENHPSVVIWDHGNEGGWDFANEKWFHKYDIQKRPVIYPWLHRNDINTKHYPDYNYDFGNDLFMPTEFLHGLYDGGLGAGLEDYWEKYQSSSLHAGGFLWVLADEAVLRTDKEGKVYDSDGNHAPDGILGPHREKEGSFYTIKEIWSPVQVKTETINSDWDGKLFLENKYIYTNLNQCSFSWKLVKTVFPEINTEIIGQGSIKSPDVKPGEIKPVQVDCLDLLGKADLLYFTAVDPHGNEIYTWSWPLKQSGEIAETLVKELEGSKIRLGVFETATSVSVILNELRITFNKGNGTLHNVVNENGRISFSGGYATGNFESRVQETSWDYDSLGNFIYTVTYKGYPGTIRWKLYRTGLLEMEAEPPKENIEDIDYLGIAFAYPEKNCKSVRWMGRGPYRVWKNRIKGSRFGVWENEYNNTITGESFNNLIYPEFKGYFGNLYWVRFETTEFPFTAFTSTPDLYLQLYKPDKPKHVAGGTFPPFPTGDISFLYEIPAIGTKFKKAESLGPGSQKSVISADESYPIKIWFDFRAK
ncbi:MAG: hypothetical protein JXR31_01870 [Prolixibacteraceae bacterium]|nr:hypothetical protein [Prolixibacteraceae bacterium]MBN2772967.1 hypothetical protein [Prolixibacteraceae bacterium]